jgi:hypothetical protein
MSAPVFSTGPDFVTTINGVQGYIQKVSINRRNAAQNVSSQNSGGFEEWERGLFGSDVSLTFVVKQSATIALNPGDKVPITHGTTGRPTYSGTLFVDSVKDDADVTAGYTVMIDGKTTGVFSAT